MIGIIDLAIAAPDWKLTAEVLSSVWGGRGRGARAMAGGDEDAITLAVEAGLRLVERNRLAAAEGVFFASTSAPYTLKSNAVIAGEVCLAARNSLALDLAGSTKAGAQALRVALDYLGTGSPETALVLAGERREAKPASTDEISFGDYGAAALVGHDNLIAEYIGSYSLSEDFPDIWQMAEASNVSRADQKFVSEQGNSRLAIEAIISALDHFNLEAEDIDQIALGLTGVDLKRARAALPFESNRYAGDELAQAGDCGCVNPLIRLAAALDSASAGQLILMVACGDGCEISLWRTTKGLEKWKANGECKAALNAGVDISNYGEYLKSRDLLGAENVDVFTSPVVLWREKETNVRRMAGKCESCGQVGYPVPAFCQACGGSGFNGQRLGSKGEIVTFTVDHLPPSPTGYVIMAVADIEGGGRFYAQLVGCNPSDVAVGMKVELVYRLLHKGGDLRHYYWKLRPAR